MRGPNVAKPPISVTMPAPPLRTRNDNYRRPLSPSSFISSSSYSSTASPRFLPSSPNYSFALREFDFDASVRLELRPLSPIDLSSIHSAFLARGSLEWNEQVSIRGEVMKNLLATSLRFCGTLSFLRSTCRYLTASVSSGLNY